MSDSFQQDILLVLSEHYAGATVELAGPVSVRDYSEIYRVHIESPSPINLAVKRCLVPQTKIPDVAAAKDQYLALERVSRAIVERDPGYRIPAPLFIDSVSASYGMSWVDGQSLTEKLHSFSIFSEGYHWFERVGAWLGNFHSAGPLHSAYFNIEERIASVANLRECVLQDKSFAYASYCLSENVAAMRNVPVQISWLHGDCKTDNFLIGEEAIFGIDISLSYENAIEYDIAQFLNHLELLVFSPKYLHLQWIRPSFEMAFWRGYRSTGPRISSTCLNWIRLWSALTLWRSMLMARRNNVRTWFLNRIFSKLALKLVKNQ
jgi:tRNA A-37 threonylcarbamoyl transferase component Bud32